MRVIINIDVPALAPAIQFYCSALGLQLSRTIDEDVAELTGAASPIFLLANAGGTAASRSNEEVRRYTRHWTAIHIDFVVDDIKEACDRALQAGAVQESDCVNWRGSKCVTFSDPFGHGFCLVEFEADTYS